MKNSTYKVITISMLFLMAISVVPKTASSNVSGLSEIYEATPIKTDTTSCLDGGVIEASQTICYNTSPDTFDNVVAASQNRCIAFPGTTFDYQWQTKTTGSWSDISGATGLTHSHGNLTQTSQFRREVTFGIFTAYSNTLTVTVTDSLISGTISATQTISSGTSPSTLTGATPTGGDGNYTYQWEISSGMGGWLDIPSSDSKDYSPGVLYNTTHFRRKVTSCGETSYSNILTITVI